MDHNLNVKPNTTKLLEETWKNVFAALGQAESFLLHYEIQDWTS